jgi:hypothetical protein
MRLPILAVSCSIPFLGTMLLSAGAAQPMYAANEMLPFDTARVRALAKMLPSKATGVGPRIQDRETWQRAADLPGLQNVVAEAESLVKRPIPELTEELYLDFSRTGNRSRCQRVISQRHGRVCTLVLAECLEDEGRFLRAIDEAILAVCDERSWLLPAHDRALNNYYGRTVEIDLNSAATSWNLATATFWLGDRLGSPIRERIQRELQRRTFEPFEKYVKTGEPRLWWATGTNNWNAVCLAGVTGSALTMIESPERRAFFVAAAEHYVKNFLKGFTPDGYCSEGLGYWNYGFGHFVLLSETISQVTAGNLDLMADPLVEAIARFGSRMEIQPGVYPAFADCSPSARPDPQIQACVDRRFGFGWADARKEAAAQAGSSRSLFDLALMDLPNASADARLDAASSEPLPLRDWFPDAGILICRSQGNRQNSLAVALKGGHNAEHHNHNDVGSFVVAWRGRTPIVDPGSEQYTARTFSSRRYESNVLNSFGHSVPRVAGTLQRNGAKAAAQILKADFTDLEDVLALDLRSAYAVDGLLGLQRTFIFSREAQGSLTIIDEVEFDKPQSFGTALITFWPQPVVRGRRVQIGQNPEAVVVEISTDGAEFDVHQEEIHEEVHSRHLPVRIGIDLTEPVKQARITMTVRPAL